MIDLRVTTLEHIARGDSLDRVMEHLCRAFETNFPHVICSVLSVDRGGMMHPLAAPSLPMTYSAALDNIAIGPNIGSCGTAAYIRAPVEVHDIATESEQVRELHDEQCEVMDDMRRAAETMHDGDHPRSLRNQMLTSADALKSASAGLREALESTLKNLQVAA